MKRLLLLSALLATSTACTPMPPNAKPSKPFPPRLAQCQADPGQRFVGQAASEDIARVCHPHPTRSEAGRQAAMGVEGWTMQS